MTASRNFAGRTSSQKKKKKVGAETASHYEPFWPLFCCTLSLYVMAPKSLAQQLAELEDPTPRGLFLFPLLFLGLSFLSLGLTDLSLRPIADFDPEDLDRGVQSSDEEGGKAVDADAGREHYQAVG